MVGVQKRKIQWAISLLLVMLYFSGFPAQAQYGGGSGTTASAETNTYVFLLSQSTVVQTGGIAGVHETYPIEGQFRLTVDFDAGTALFSQVDANLVDESPFLPTESLVELFNMAELLGTVVDDTIIDFVGKTADGMEGDILLTLTFRDDSAHLTGHTVPPPHSADFFIFELDAVAQRKYGGGTGEPNDPYLIYTAEQLNTIGLNKEDADKHFKLMADIDLSAYKGDSFNRIGFYDPPPTAPSYWHPPFTGVFDGNNHTISNFTYVVDVNEPPAWGYDGDWDVGLFGVINGPEAQIKNLGLIDPNIYPAATCSERVSGVGALAGDLRQGSITNCYVKGGRVLADVSVGGLVGGNGNMGTISDCYTTCYVTWAKNRWLRPIEEPWGNTGYSFGGLAGYNGGRIYNCYATGRVEADSVVGGLVGGNSYHERYEIVISDSYATGDVSGVESVGGLIGRNDDTIRRCCAFGNVSGLDMVGGLVGINTRWGIDQYVGIVTNSYAMSRIFGNNHIGGIAGVNMGMLMTCYSTGEVVGISSTGGLVGTNQYLSKAGTADNCFWDQEISGQWTSAGGTGLSTGQMQTAGTFLEAGWDFVGESTKGTEDIWRIFEGQDYPRLWWQLLAFSPDPHNGAVNVIQPLILSWVAGGSALQHDIYFGEDEEAVANATTESTGIYRGRQVADVTSYDPGILEWDKTYYWRIDEVNDTDPRSPWKGNVWSFTTVKFLVVDDFESYNDLNPDDPKSNRIFYTWIDGYEQPTNGSQVGYVEPPFTEQTIVHGGNQSMPYFYDNSGQANYSETTANIANLVIDQDWTKYGATVLSLWFYGDPANAAEPMYVAIANYNGPTAVVDNPDAALIDTWTEWTIDLQEFAVQGVNLTDVDTISIGFGDKNNPQDGGSGEMWFDDIRLYGPR